MYVLKSFTRLNSSNTGKHFDHCTLKSILLLCINAFKTWCERCFCGEKIERPFPNNVHTATLSVNCIETELTFVSKTCAVFYLTKSIRPEHVDYWYTYKAVDGRLHYSVMTLPHVIELSFELICFTILRGIEYMISY